MSGLPENDEIWLEGGYLNEPRGLVKIFNVVPDRGIVMVRTYPDGFLRTVSREDLLHRVENEMEIIAWAAK